MNITTLTPLSLSEVTEKDIEQYIIDNPSILSLGEVSIIKSQLIQEYGILDLLAYDSVSNIYYEIELMLGDADSRHITHILEYWANERTNKIYSTHIAVLLTESVRGRYQPLLSVLPDFLPLICSEFSLYQYNDDLIINCQHIYYPNKLYKKVIKSKKRTDIRISNLFISFIDKIILNPSILKMNRRDLSKETNTSLGSSTNFINNLKDMNYIDNDYNIINISKLEEYIKHLHQVFDNN